MIIAFYPGAGGNRYYHYCQGMRNFDNQTTYEFVVETLMQYFDYTVETAQTITADIHEAGSACVAVLPYEIAEQKGIEVTMLARAQQYPLQIRVEPEGAV